MCPVFYTWICPWYSTLIFSDSVRSITYPVVTFDQLTEHVVINKDLLDQPCSTKHLTRIATLIPNWLQYARALKLTQPQIQDIDGERMSNNAMKTQKMIEIWHETNGFNATYHRLIDVCLAWNRNMCPWQRASAE